MLDAQNHNESPPNEDYGQCSSPSRGFGKKRCWGSSYSESVNQSLDRSDFDPETRSAQSQSVSPSHRERPGYDSISRHLDHRVCSPDRLIHASSAQNLPAIYGGQMTNGEESIILPDYEREVSPKRQLLKLCSLFSKKTKLNCDIYTNLFILIKDVLDIYLQG